MNALMFALIFPFTDLSLGNNGYVKSKSVQQEEHWYGCGVEAIDIRSENRFKVCGGKSVRVPAYEDKSECGQKKAELLDQIIALEKKYNVCKSWEDCIAGEVGRLAYHVNRSAIRKVSREVDASFARVRAACQPESSREGWTMNAVHKKDSRNVQSYTCEVNVCVPHFKGNLLDWSESGRRDWLKERGRK